MKRKQQSMFHKEDESLENLAAQSVFGQFLAKFPEQLGAMLSKCPPEARSIAIKSLDTEDVVSARITTKEMMVAPVFSVMDEITVIKLRDGESADEIEYFTVRPHSLDERIGKVLTLWLEQFYKENPDEETRINLVERDGSATLCLNHSMEALQDYIEEYVVLSNAVATFMDDGSDDDDESDEDFDKDDEIETVTNMIRDFFEDGAGPQGFGYGNLVRLYRPIPKITIRYFTD